ncbi:hypothetical protein TAMA11512_23790 [Selenomonas sp. TAMA-11512]|nr:hypothetical protein TAMA11512_23790 [Selenomonas sp. TAMA-11512]
MRAKKMCRDDRAEFISDSLNKAAKAKKDEFYTELTDIEKEMRYYRDYFKGKVVFCNCDDPFESNFFKYFAMNFNSLGLKKLIATCYVSSAASGTELKYYVEKMVSYPLCLY